MRIAGEPKNIKNLRSGDLLIQCTKQPHEANLLKMKTFCRLKCTVKPHKSLNTSKGIVRCPALSKQSCEHIIEFMGEQGVTDVRRINVHRDGSLKTLESPYHLAAVSGAHFTQGTILIVILVSSGSAKSRTHQSAVGGFLVTRRGWPGRLRACRIWTFINSV